MAGIWGAVMTTVLMPGVLHGSWPRGHHPRSFSCRHLVSCGIPVTPLLGLPRGLGCAGDFTSTTELGEDSCKAALTSSHPHRQVCWGIFLMCFADTGNSLRQAISNIFCFLQNPKWAKSSQTTSSPSLPCIFKHLLPK